jgi:hypothetical protein
VGEPLTNSVVERFNHTLKEQIIHGHTYKNCLELAAFAYLCNREWRLEKFRFRSPLDARRDHENALRLSAAPYHSLVAFGHFGRFAAIATWLRQMAEREGFEPSVGCPTHAFQASAFDHSATSPGVALDYRREAFGKTRAVRKGGATGSGQRRK